MIKKLDRTLDDAAVEHEKSLDLFRRQLWDQWGPYLKGEVLKVMNQTVTVYCQQRTSKLRQKSKTSFPDLPQVKKVNINKPIGKYSLSTHFVICNMSNMKYILLEAAYTKKVDIPVIVGTIT